MAEKKHVFASPELHWLNSYLKSSHAVKRNALIQNLVSVPANQDNRNNPNLVAHENSSKSSPNGKGTNIKGELLKDITSATFDIAATTAVAPMKRVYMLMQCQNEMIKAGRLSTPYKGIKDCFLRTIKHEGVRSLWRGNSVTVISLCTGEAFVFAFGHLPYKNYMVTKLKESPLWGLPFFVVPLMLCQYPLDYARVRLATDLKVDKKSNFSLDFSRNNFGKRQFNGVFDVYKKTLRLDGIHGLYRGFSVSCIGLFAYDLPKRLNPSSSNATHNQKKPTMLAWMVMQSLPVVFHPVDTVSRRMMMTSGEASKYRGVMDAFYQIVKTEGVSSLFKGATPYMIHNIATYWVKIGLLYMTLLMLESSNTC